MVDAGLVIYSKLGRWTHTLPQRWQSCRRRLRGEIPVNSHVRIQIIVISSRSNYSRVASISFHAWSGVATIRERHLFESGIYSVIYGTRYYIPQCCVYTTLHVDLNDPISHLWTCDSHLATPRVLPEHIHCFTITHELPIER